MKNSKRKKELELLQEKIASTPAGSSNYARMKHAIMETRVQQLVKQIKSEKKTPLTRAQIRKKTLGKLRIAYMKNQMKLISTNLAIKSTKKKEMSGREKAYLRDLRERRETLITKREKLLDRLEAFAENRKERR